MVAVPEVLGTPAAAADQKVGPGIAAERLTDQPRVLFDGDYLREHITLGYASTVHSAQGINDGFAAPDSVVEVVDHMLR